MDDKCNGNCAECPLYRCPSDDDNEEKDEE